MPASHQPFPHSKQEKSTCVQPHLLSRPIDRPREDGDIRVNVSEHVQVGAVPVLSEVMLVIFEPWANVEPVQIAERPSHALQVSICSRHA